MPTRRHPRRSSLQYWPRRRASRQLARIRSWPKSKENKPLGFIGYKAGMLHLLVIDNRPKSLSKDEEICMPATVIECPPMKVFGFNVYQHGYNGLMLRSTVLSENLDKELARKICLPKKTEKKEIKDFDTIRLLVHSQPKLVGLGKKPQIRELGIGGNKDEQLKFAREKLGKEILIEEVFKEGNLVDLRGVTKGKGFEGPVKRHGVDIRQHKSEKGKRANVRGPWEPSCNKMWTTPHSGQMGYHLRTELNKQVLKIGKNGEEVTPKSGFNKYGLIKNSFVLIKGSVMGPPKRVITLAQTTRGNAHVPKEAPAIRYILK